MQMRILDLLICENFSIPLFRKNFLAPIWLRLPYLIGKSAYSHSKE